MLLRGGFERLLDRLLASMGNMGGSSRVGRSQLAAFGQLVLLSWPLGVLEVPSLPPGQARLEHAPLCAHVLSDCVVDFAAREEAWVGEAFLGLLRYDVDVPAASVGIQS